MCMFSELYFVDKLNNSIREKERAVYSNMKILEANT